MTRAPESEKDETYCPDCYEGLIETPCVCTQGGRYPADEDCGACNGTGCGPSERCSLCQGEGVVTLAVMKLRDADRWVRANEPDWDGDDASHPGITVFSKAKWWRMRGTFGPVRMARSRPYEDDVWGAVELVGDGGKTVKFLGFAWGYPGEGPTGLAAVLADAMPERFPTFQAARQFVCGLPQHDAWSLTGASGLRGGHDGVRET